MYMLKVCRCCDAIVGELETDDSGIVGVDYALEVTGNVAYTLCSQCMQELDGSRLSYYQ
jgi:hypothetical protein